MNGHRAHVGMWLLPVLLIPSLGGCQWMNDNIAPIAGGAIGAGVGYGVGKALGLSDKQAAGLAVIGAGVGVVAGIQIKQANEQERQRAEIEALQARQNTLEKQLQDMRDKDVKFAVKANDAGDVMVVDPQTGKVVDDKVYRPSEEGLSGGYGKLGDHSVIFAG